jgi:type I restriction enzyme, S subunit
MIFERKYFSWIPDTISEKEIVRIKDIFILSREISSDPSKEKILSLTQKGIIVRDISSNKGQIAESYDKYNKIKTGYIVLNPMDLLTGWVDISKYEGLISPSYKTLRLIDESESTEFYCYQLQRYYKQKIFYNYGQGVSYSYRWGLNDEILMNFPIIRKPIDIQNKVVQEIKSVLQDNANNIKQYENKIKLYKELNSLVLNNSQR